jgi:uncharacterized membrane protein (UPF0127 family)
MAAALVVALGALTAAIVIVVGIRSNESDVGRLRFAATMSPAPAPFGAFLQARVALGARCLRVLVASTESQRVQGLRGVPSLAFDGMIFVFPRDTEAQFTMADTPMLLDITFFSAAGAPVDHTRMTPCPRGTDATCPAYASKQHYRYALERPAGSAPASGALGSCA